MHPGVHECCCVCSPDVTPGSPPAASTWGLRAACPGLCSAPWQEPQGPLCPSLPWDRDLAAMLAGDVGS